MLKLAVRVLIAVAMAAGFWLSLDGELATAKYVGLGATGPALPVAVDCYVIAALASGRKRESGVALIIMAASVGGGHALLGASGGDIDSITHAGGSGDQAKIGFLVGVLIVIVLWRVKELGVAIEKDYIAAKEKAKKEQEERERQQRDRTVAEQARREIAEREREDREFYRRQAEADRELDRQKELAAIAAAARPTRQIEATPTKTELHAVPDDDLLQMVRDAFDKLTANGERINKNTVMEYIRSNGGKTNDRAVLPLMKIVRAEREQIEEVS